MAHYKQIVDYVRVGSPDQRQDRQLEAVGDVDRVFEEKASRGSRSNRVAPLDCIGYVRDGDTVRAASIDRLARALGDVRNIVDKITSKGASVVFVKEPQTNSRDTDDAFGRLMLKRRGAFAAFGHTLVRERQREWIRISKAAGEYRGRARKLTDDRAVEACRLITGAPKAAVARDLGVDRTTPYRMLAASTLAPTQSDPRPECMPLRCVAHGSGEGAAIAAAVEAPLSSSAPDSALELHEHATVVYEEAAAGLQLCDHYGYAHANKPA